MTVPPASATAAKVSAAPRSERKTTIDVLTPDGGSAAMGPDTSVRAASAAGVARTRGPAGPPGPAHRISHQPPARLGPAKTISQPIPNAVDAGDPVESDRVNDLPDPET